MIQVNREIITRSGRAKNERKNLKTLNRYDTERDGSKSMNQRVLAARDFVLSNGFSFIPMRLSVLEILFRKAKVIFNHLTLNSIKSY